MKKEIINYPSYKSFKYNSQEAIEYNNSKDEELIFHFDYLNTKWKIDFNVLIDHKDSLNQIVSDVEKQTLIINHQIDKEEFFKNANIIKTWRNDYSSQLIEGVDKKNHDAKQRKEFFECQDNSKSYLKNINKLSIDNLPEIYQKISNDQKLINVKTNELLNKDINFRQKDIFINNKALEVTPDLIVQNLVGFCELFNDVNLFKFTSNDLITSQKDLWLNQEITKTLYPAAILHFLFEHIHPFPDFNGRIGRIIYDEFIRRNFEGLEAFENIFTLSDVINATKDKYYEAIQQTETSKDLTYILSYYRKVAISNLEFLAFERKHQNTVDQLNPYQKVILVNIFINKNQISATEYIKKFNYDKTKQQLHNDLNKLDELDLLDYQEHKNSLRRYYIKK